MRLAHFSDAHALSLEGVRPWQFLNKRVAGYANLRWKRRDKHPVRLFEALVEDLNREPPDEVVVTGDLTNLSLDPEFALARRLLDGIRLGPGHVTVVPGNHDVYTLGALRERLFAARLGPYALSDGAHALEFPTVRVRGELAIVGASTALPSPPPLADGWLGRAQLGALEQKLLALDGKFRVLRASVAGPRGAIPVIGVGSATYDDPRADRRARYNVYRIEGGRLLDVETRVHDAGSGRFTPAAA